jgi:hypothetical protein
MSEWVRYEGDEHRRLVHEWRQAFAADDEELMTDLKQRIAELDQIDDTGSGSAI